MPFLPLTAKLRYGKKIRKPLETTFSKISNWLSHHIHAVSNRGFLLKIMLLMAAFAMDFCIELWSQLGLKFARNV